MQEKLLVLRSKHNYSKTFLASKLGITVQTYSKKERGDYEFTSDEMFILKNLFEEKLEDIFLPRNHQNGDKDYKVSPK